MEKACYGPENGVAGFFCIVIENGVRHLTTIDMFVYYYNCPGGDTLNVTYMNKSVRHIHERKQI